VTRAEKAMEKGGLKIAVVILAVALLGALWLLNEAIEHPLPYPAGELGELHADVAAAIERKRFRPYDTIRIEVIMKPGYRHVEAWRIDEPEP
jgi:hypothetical protein